ncbi:uncharacterized protein EAF01_004250 [Botrytis porri]|uniref:Thioesterase domain-containing protein n=1 Tax=Botrytis porri TaxID=87229 RepID=A0A4Z1KH41_9HELO|nr:uncharacterized protein EAF01_004250 [Botrytis porri]KAF7908495.1 hypothetical protein EAF01_004250 [Botrytis porri]TGO83552.1 hypothetical protein BPOR_0628g00020 [Botrytis porri]
MAPIPKFKSALEASSYQSPDGGPAYSLLRKKVVDMAIAMGYDASTMVECGVNWSDDHDPFKHVKNHAYPHYVNQCNFRVFQSFEAQLGERFQDLLDTQHIGVVVKTYTIDLKRVVKFPDSLIVANHITEVLPDRYFGVTSIWSLRQQAIVADCRGYVVFFDYDRGVPANLVEAGGVYKDLYDALVERKEKEIAIAAKWEEEHPKKVKAAL